MMRALGHDEVLDLVGETLGLSDASATDLIKPALRRGLFLLAPSSRADLIQFVAAPLVPLGITRHDIEAKLDELVTYGDALEMRKLASDPWDAPPAVLRPAPPSFVKRGDGALIILGVAGDHLSALTPELQARVVETGPVRLLRASDDDALPAHLKLLGLMQLSEQAWLRTPKVETAVAHRQSWIAQLERVAETAGRIDDLEILDPERSIRFYAGRWHQQIASTTGIFVARRPQLYGARLWSIAQFTNGACHRLLDVYEDEERQRPCDIAWRLQAAIDAAAGHPQEVRVEGRPGIERLDFFSPLPAFAERRLALIGTKQAGTGCLFSFDIDPVHVEAELTELKTSLWMRPVREEESR